MENLPPFENARLLEIERLRILDRPADKDIDDIVDLFRATVGAETCALNLITEDRQIEKFVSGKKLGNIRREDSFCQHVVNGNKALYVEQALADDRFKKSRYVAGKPGIRAYAGVPLHGVNKLPIGSLCMIDTSPRNFSSEDKKTLEIICRMLRRRLIPGVSAEISEDLPSVVSGADEFIDRFNTLLCDARRKKKEKTTLLFFQEAETHQTGRSQLAENLVEARRATTERLADIAQNAEPHFEVGVLGEDQFALALNSSHSDEEIRKFANRCLTALRKPVQTRTGYISSEMTVTVFVDDESIHDPVEILSLCRFTQGYHHMEKPNVMFLNKRRIDQAMRLGLGRTRISEALTERSISVVFQPIVCATKGTLNGYEALVRWNEPELGPFTAPEILELCDLEGLHESLDYAVMELACSHAVEREKRTGEKATIAVNIDVASLTSPEFVRTTRNILSRTKFDPELLEIELTEHSVIDDPDLAIRRMEQLIKLGVSFVLDDFGTGFSSLTHLHRLPISKLKIDQSFVSKIHKEKSATLVRSIIATARLLGVKTTGEGVEDKDQFIALNSMGCDNIQGYGISKPLDVDKFLQPFGPSEKVA